jgi:hypothetical protein
MVETKLMARIGAEMAGPLVGLCVLTWDVWDHRRTVAVQRPVLRRSIEEYLGQVRVDLLHGPAGIASVLDRLDRELVPSLQLAAGRP